MTRDRLDVTLLLVAAAVSFLLSIGLWLTRSRDETAFVGLSVPSILAAGSVWMLAVRTRISAPESFLAVATPIVTVFVVAG